MQKIGNKNIVTIFMAVMVAKPIEVFKKALAPSCGNGYTFCKKVVLMTMLLGKRELQLLDKEVEVLSVMCKCQMDGLDAMNVRTLMDVMKECGVSGIGVGTLKNYKTKLRNKGWVEGKRLHFRIREAIADGGSAVGIFLERNAQ